MKNLFFTLAVLVCSMTASAKLTVATTTTDLAAIVTAVGQDKIDVFSLAKGTQDPHQIEAKPSFMVKLRSADIVFAQGLELETAWITPLIQGARNPKLTAKDGLYEVASELDPIEVQKGNVSRAEGDVHPGGNPHFQLDPIRIGKAAILIAARLSILDSSHKDFYTKNAETFQTTLIEKTKQWEARLKKTAIQEIVTYHKTFSYFCNRFNIVCSIQLEPKPGIPPTANHLLTVIEQMKKRKINLVLIENLYENTVEGKIKQDIPHAVVERVPVSVGGEPNIATNEQLIERIVKAIETGVQH
ncbi:MAG: metal ABC transporter substrate-binding protein [Pseudobdellovibrionaceae bacterium]